VGHKHGRGHTAAFQRSPPQKVKRSEKDYNSTVVRLPRIEGWTRKQDPPKRKSLHLIQGFTLRGGDIIKGDSPGQRREERKKLNPNCIGIRKKGENIAPAPKYTESMLERGRRKGKTQRRKRDKKRLKNRQRRIPRIKNRKKGTGGAPRCQGGRSQKSQKLKKRI